VRKLTLSLAVMAALLPLRGYSLGLGDLELHSALNQELNAEIEVTSAAAEDAEQILIKLADREAFNRAGLDRPFLLQQLKFKMIDKNGVPFVKVYTKAPVREPFLSFLLEIDWPQGHLLREYTLLLDPPVYNNSTAGANNNSSFNEPADTQAQAQSGNYQQQNAQSVQGSASNVQTGVISSDGGRSETYQYQALPAATSSADQYRVQQNDTLWGIANRMRPDSSISVEQMMLALVRKNPEAFIRENMNGVKRGYILRMPDRDALTQVDRQQAVEQAREHSALWREYSHAAASSSPASSMEADAMGDAMDAGSAGEQARDADGHLSIMGAGEGGEHTGSNQDIDAQVNQLKQDLAIANEQLESERLEKEDLRSRLAELEQRVKSVIEGGGVVEMDDAELAKLQEDLQSTQQAVQADDLAASMPDEPAANDDMSDAPVSDDMAMDDTSADESATDTLADESAIEDAGMEDAGMGDASAENTPAEDAIFADEAETSEAGENLPADEMADTQLAEPQSDPVTAVTPPAFAQQKPKGFIEGLLDDKKLLGMIAGGLAFILMLIALLLKRIRGSKAEEDEWTAGMMDPADDSAENDFSGIGGSELDADPNDATLQSETLGMDQTAEMAAEATDDSSMDITRVKVPETEDEDTVFNLDNAKAESEDDERDDVIAEADVYLAYGIYQQAEELLNTAIDQNPDRDDYRLKLLETHYAAKNAAAFEELAVDVKSRKGDDKSYWDRVVAMGMELSPTNELFSGSDVLSDFDADALLPSKPQTTDLELDAGDDAADFDLGLDSELDDSGFDDAELDDLGLDVEDTQVDTQSADTQTTGTQPADTGELDLAGDLEDIASELDSTEAEADDSSSELEFDLGEMDDVEEATESSAAAADATEMDIDDDFSLDFDAADLGFEENEDDAQEEVSLDLDDDSEDESVEIDLSDDLGDDLGDGLSDDLGDAGEMDLGGIDDLDLNDSGAEEIDVSADISDDDDEFDISELSEDVDEVSTKLDLARAYIDMGDNDGARSILEEVKAEGNDEQQQQAEELMQKAS